MAQTTPLIDTTIEAKLKASGYEYSLYSHPDFSTCERSSTWHNANHKQGQRLKNLFLRNKNGKQHFLLLLPHEIDFDKALFKDHSGQKCGLASDERLWEYLKIKPGAVSPLNLVFDTEQHVQVFIEASLLEADYLHLHVGFPHSSVQFKPDDLRGLLSEWGYDLKVIQWMAPKRDD